MAEPLGWNDGPFRHPDRNRIYLIAYSVAMEAIKFSYGPLWNLLPESIKNLIEDEMKRRADLVVHSLWPRNCPLKNGENPEFHGV